MAPMIAVVPDRTRFMLLSLILILILILIPGPALRPAA
jgi:hypothetical protein